MATPEPETSEPSDPSQPTGDMNEPHNSVSMLPEDDARARADGQAPDATLGLSSEARSLQSQSHEETLSSPNHITTSEVTSAAPQSSQVQDEHGAVRSPNPIPFTPISEKDIVSPAGFAFSRLDRRNIGLGGKQQESQQVARDEDRFAARASPNLENSAQTTSVVTLEHTASSTAAVGSDDAHYHSSATTPYEPDVLSDGNQMSAESQAGESVQYQVDEQIYQEASMSDGIERRSSPVPQSEDVIYMGANLPRSAGTVPIDSVGGQRSPHVLQPFLRRPEMRKHISSPGSARLSLDRRTPPGVPARMPARDSSVKVIERRPVQQAQVQSYAHATAPDAATTGMQELLEVVQYKFKQNEQQLRRAFSADSNKLRRELQQAYEENADLRSQLLAFEDRCERSEAAIVKYRGQIGKAKNLQKFLDGLGSDLHSLKRSYDAEKSSFAKRIEISETEITRLESTLASKNGFESMLSHSKASLERLLEARGFELQSVVQHRDMLRSQLDERIGQLVEERDSRLRLEQLVAELSGSDRASLTTSIEQCKTSLMSKFGELGRQDDQLILDVAGLQDAVRRLAERPSVSSDDFDAIKAEMHDLWLRIVQSLSAEATADMTVAEVSSSMEGIIQNHMQALHQGLARLQSASEQTANNASAHATFQLELQSAADRLRRTETELEAAKQSEVNLNDALVQSRARVSELEAEPVPAAANSTIQITSQDVEDKVNEAVSEVRKQFSDSANTFIAQEKARYSNGLKKAVSEHRKAMGELQTQRENVNKLQSELQQLRSSAKAATGKSHVHQLEEMKGRFRALEEKYNAAQAEIGEKRSLESNLATAQAERETAVAKLSTFNTQITAMKQEIEHSRTALSQTRAAEAQAKTQVVELRDQSKSSIDDLCRKLSQAEERSKYAESGLAQMKASAEKTISEEQEKHRRQREALQQRLDEAQSELQAKSEEADETRAFVERTVTHQQTVWQRSHAELESKASDYKAKLEEKTRLLESAGNEQDTLREEMGRLQAEVEGHLRAETEHLSREDISKAAIDDIRSELETARNEVSSLQAVQQRYLREKDERSYREIKAKTAVDDLRKDHDAAKALIASLQASEKQNKHDEAERNDRANKKEKEVHDARTERDTVHAALEELQARFNEQQALRANEIEHGRWVAPQAEQEEQFLTDTMVPPPPKPQQLVATKQRKRADRNTNTIVSSEVGRVSAVARSTRSNVLSERAQVVIPAQNVMSLMTSQPDEMLDVASSQPRRRPESRFVSSMQEYQASNKSAMRGHTKPTQAFTASLNFSGEPLVASRDVAALRAPTLDPSHSPPGPNFKIYEDLEDSVNDGPDRESAVRANFTFRKPFPLPNSGSKRLSRTKSDRSFEGHSASSHGARRTPENAGGIVSSRARNTPEVSKYGFGSSPEFMNPPSSMTKRRYSGNAPGTPGNQEPSAPRRSMTPLPNPRVAKRAGGNKRVATRDGQQNSNLEPSTKKRNVAETFTRSATERSSDGSFLGRSSQSVSDLPRAEDLNAGRATSQMPSSHMRTSAGTSRVTRNRKGTKDDAYKARFNQELRYP